MIYDQRIFSKRYSRAFIDSLPRCTVLQDPNRALPAAAAR
jgi:hypothetical protein